jgi:nucleotide-binding universal stress UspA family protein
MKTILIATDFSKTATNAARYAVKLSQALSVEKIVLYHSYDSENIDVQLVHEASLLGMEVLKQEIQPLIKKHIDIEVITNEQPLIAGINRLVETHAVGMVVAGSTGKGGLTTFLLGSNTINLAVKETTPVKELGYFVEELKAKLLVLNVALEHKRFNPDIIPEQYQIHQILQHLKPAYHYIEEETIVEGITEFIDDEDAQIVITVPKTYGFFNSLFRRSVTKKLAYDTEIPLLVLREQEKQG